MARLSDKFQSALLLAVRITGLSYACILAVCVRPNLYDSAVPLTAVINVLYTVLSTVTFP